MAFVTRTAMEWKLRTRTLSLGSETAVMGILNVTPDSFSDGGRVATVEDAVAAALRMLNEGATAVDIGGESTRPGAIAVEEREEQDRVLPVIEALLRERPEALLSIDTFHAGTAKLAAEAGVEIVNDVSGLGWDAAMAETCGRLGCGVVVMHTRGKPGEWAKQPGLSPREVMPGVIEGLEVSLVKAGLAGIDSERIVIDPGFGFGKRGMENYALHAGLAELRRFGRPILAGTSRKGFLAETLAMNLRLGHGGKRPGTADRLYATLASNTAAVLSGAHILRVHDVRAAVEAASIADAILLASAEVAASADHEVLSRAGEHAPD